MLWSPPSLQEFTAQVGGHLDRCWEQKSGSADRVCVCGWVLLRITFPQPEGDQVDYSKTCLKGAPFLAEAFVLDSEWEETRATGRPAGWGDDLGQGKCAKDHKEHGSPAWDLGPMRSLSQPLCSHLSNGMVVGCHGFMSVH